MSDPFIKLVKRRVYGQDKDAVIVMAGERGSTKSGSSISLGYALDKDEHGKSRFRLPETYLPKGFKLRKGEVMPRVVFTPSHFLKLLAEEDLPKGSVIIFDEIGVGGDSREFMSKKNKMLKQTMETVRSRNLILFLTAPTFASFDISFRRSMSFYLKCMGQGNLLHGGKCGLVKPYHVNVDPQEGTIYTKYIRWVEKETGITKKLMLYRVPRPPAFLEEPYKRLKKYMQTELYAGFLKEMELAGDYFDESKAQAKVDSKKAMMDSYLDQILQRKDDFYDKSKYKFDKASIKHEFGLSPSVAQDIVGILNFKLRKGEIQVD